MKVGVFARPLKKLGLLVIFVALARGVVIWSFASDWDIAAGKLLFGKEMSSCIQSLLDERGEAAFAVNDAACLSEVEDKIARSRVAAHPEYACLTYTTSLCIAIGYAMYILACIVDRSFAMNGVRYWSWFRISALILVPMFLLPLWPRRFQISASEKAVARCREIAPPQNLDSNVKALVDIILEKEAKR